MTVAKFAKEINKETADVLAVLKSRGDEIKGSNTISDEQIEFVKSKIAPKKAEAPKVEEKKAEAPKAETEKTAPASDNAPKKKKPGIIIVRGGDKNRKPQGARPEGNRPQAASQNARPQQGNNARAGYSPIKTNVRTSASRLLDEDMKVKPQAQPAPEKKKVVQPEQVEEKKVVQQEQPKAKPIEGVKNEQPKNVPERNKEGNKEHAQKSNDNRKPASNMGGDSRRSERSFEKTDRQQGSNKPRVSFGGQGMRQQGGQQNGQNRGGSFGGAAAANINNAPGSGKDNRRNHDKKKNDKTSQYEDGFRGKQGGKGQKVKMLEKPTQVKQEVKEEEKIKVITIPEMITIKDLAEKMKMAPAQIIKELFLKGQMFTVNQ